MKVKIGNMIVDGSNEPIMVILSETDKENIKNMSKHCTMYAAFPEGTPKEVVNKFMVKE